MNYLFSGKLNFINFYVSVICCLIFSPKGKLILNISKSFIHSIHQKFYSIAKITYSSLNSNTKRIISISKNILYSVNDVRGEQKTYNSGKHYIIRSLSKEYSVYYCQSIVRLMFVSNSVLCPSMTTWVCIPSLVDWTQVIYYESLNQSINE